MPPIEVPANLLLYRRPVKLRNGDALARGDRREQLVASPLADTEFCKQRFELAAR
jgi:hypothetical protein